ncbi:MAG: head GIN domain-containing protein [Bacteroidota bacterium]
MKQKLFSGSLLIAAILFTGLAHAQKKESIEGSGNVITKQIAVQPFDALTAGGVFNVILQQGSKEEVKIEAEDNLQPLFEVKNEGSALKISFKRDVNLKHAKKMNVYVTFKNLKSLNLSSVGNITATGSLKFDDLQLENSSVGNVDLDLAAQKLNVKNSSVGSLKLSGKADNAVIKSNSVGSIDAGGLVVQVMDIQNDGVGGAEVNAVKELKVRDSFLGKVRNTGSATAKKVSSQVI